MKWFEGSITEAVTASKAKKAVFVVFVQGKDDVSQTVEQTLNSQEVSSRLESDQFVAIKLQSDSENYTFFAQIYQLVPVPSIFFIGENGKPLEIIGNQLSPSELASKIDSIVQKSQPSTDLINAEKESAPKNEENAENKLNEALQNSDESGAASPNSEYSQEEKLLRAKRLIELQNKKRQEDEERRERERELERRRSGKDIQKLRQQMHEREIREAQQERAKEKAAEQAAREKILKQIAEDKLERKRKFEMQNQETAQQKKPEQVEPKPKPVPSGDLSKARIQFKLPTGSNITGTFESSSTLGTLRTYVSENAQLPYRQFAMSLFFPRKDLTTADDDKTLLELDLVPSSTILILPIKSSNPASVVKSTEGAGIFSSFLWTLFAPVVSIYNYVLGYFSGRPRTGENSGDNENRNSGSSAASNAASLRLERFANMGMNRRPGNQGVSTIRSRGNVHSLHSGNDDNDENNTWNGNSTQQM